MWPSDLRRSGRRSEDAAHGAPDPESDDDRRGNLLAPADAGGRPRGTRGAARGRRRSSGEGRRPPSGEAPPSDPGSAESGRPGADPARELRPGPDPVSVVKAYVEGVQQNRVRAHEAHRRLAERLGTPALVSSVDAWARRWTRTGGRETVLGRARAEGDRAVVETTGEGFGPVRYRLVSEGDGWLLDGVEGACPDCEGSGRCPVCGGDGCDACAQGLCPACEGAAWVPYRK